MSETALAETQPLLPATVEPIPVSMLAIIDRAARDPEVDVDKLERLMAMAERLQEREARTQFAAALAIVQPNLPIITEKGRIRVPAKDGKAGHETPYALWEDINEAIRPVLAENGFALSFRIGHTEEGKVKVTGVLSHRGGHQEETTIILMQDSTGSKNSVQAIGSSVSYGKRYTAMALLNITSRGEDDDGKAAGQGETLSAEQVEAMKAKMKEVRADEAKFLALGNVEKVEDILAADFDKAMARLDAKARQARRAN